MICFNQCIYPTYVHEYLNVMCWDNEQGEYKNIMSNIRENTSAGELL